MPEIAASRFDAMTAAAIALDSPWERFVAFVEGMVELQASDKALNDAIARRYPDASKLLLVCDNLPAVGGRLIQEAHATVRYAPTSPRRSSSLCSGRMLWPLGPRTLQTDGGASTRSPSTVCIAEAQELVIAAVTLEERNPL